MHRPGREATESHAQSPRAHPKTEQDCLLSDYGPHEQRVSLATIRQGNSKVVGREGLEPSTNRL